MSEQFFMISGNYQQYNQWSQPDPGFVGHILIDEDGVFKGYMEDLYTHPTGISPLRFVTGVYFEKDSKLAYYKLIDSYDYAALLYVFKNTSDLGIWIAFNIGSSDFGGVAKIELKSVESTPELLKKIQEIEEKVLKGPDWNKDLASRAANLDEVFDLEF